MKRAALAVIAAAAACALPPSRAYVDLDALEEPRGAALRSSTSSPGLAASELTLPGRPAEVVAPPDIRERVRVALESIVEEQARLAAALEDRLAGIARRTVLAEARETREDLRQARASLAEEIADNFRAAAARYAPQLGWLRLQLAINEGWPDPDPDGLRRPSVLATKPQEQRLAESHVLRTEIEALEGSRRLAMAEVWTRWAEEGARLTEESEAAVEEALRRAAVSAAQEAREAVSRLVQGLGTVPEAEALVLKAAQELQAESIGAQGLAKELSISEPGSARSSSRRALEARAKIWVEAQGWEWSETPQGAVDRTEEFRQWK